MQKMVELIFSYESKNGINCMIVSFDMMAKYLSETDKFPDSSMPMFNEIESTIFYLIKLAEDNKLNMNKILNSVTENGKTLFWNAALYSESVANELLKRKVDVKIVDLLFQTTTFRVS